MAAYPLRRRRPLLTFCSLERRQTTAIIIISALLLVFYSFSSWEEVWMEDKVKVAIDDQTIEKHVDPTISSSKSVSQSVAAHTMIDAAGINKEKAPRIKTTTIDYAHVFDSAIKRKYGEGWQIIMDWSSKDMTIDSNPHAFHCSYSEFQATSGRSAEMCLHPFRDVISDDIKRTKSWKDCRVLSKRWNEYREKNADDTEILYVEVGANIGACVMEMLLSTDAPILAFEPHPRNLFALKETIKKLDKSLQNRVVLVPIALGSEQGVSKIYSGHDNLGNSIIGAQVKDWGAQKFLERDQFEIQIESLDTVLKPGPKIPLLKMDAQGYECRIVDGFGQDLANIMQRVHFEKTDKFLRAQNCNDLLPKLRKYGFVVYMNENITVTELTRLPAEVELDAVQDLIL
jgi:FkbM family methyltransferase